MAPRAAGSKRQITVALIGLVVLVVGGWLVKVVADDQVPLPSPTTTAVSADSSSNVGSIPGSESGLPTKALSSLPSQVAETWQLIRSHGPFPYPNKDGSVFGNREKLLPVKESGYYREYTVKTPASSDRGARRLISGKSAELYYTEDHYASFVVVDTTK